MEKSLSPKQAKNRRYKKVGGGGCMVTIVI